MASLTGSTLGALPLQLDPNAKDFETIRQRAIELIQTITPEWTDFYPTDPGVALLESVASIATVLHYTLDRVQNESYLLTAQQRSSVVDLLRLIGYRMRPAGAASAGLRIETSQAVVLPRLWSVSTRPAPGQAPFRFELLSEVTIPGAGVWDTTSLPELVAVEGTTISQEAGLSSGAPRQRVRLTQGPIVASSEGTSIRVFVGPALWTETDDLTKHGPLETVFSWREDNRGDTLVQFGDGVNGAIPPTGDEVLVEYRIGGGEAANSIGRGEITNLGVATPGVISVTNPLPPSGGADPESLSEAKLRGPLSLRALDRAVTLEDYATLAGQVPGVLAAFAVHGRGPHEVIVYVAAEGPSPIPTGQWFARLQAGSGLLGIVGRYLLSRRATPKLDVQPVRPVRPVFRANIQVLPNIVRQDVAAAVDRALREYYRAAARRPGALVPLSDLVRVIENTRGVDYVDVLAFHRRAAPTLIRGYGQAFAEATTLLGRLYPTAIGGDYQIEWLNGALYRVLSPTGAPLRGPDGRVLRFVEGAQHRISLFSLTTDPSQRQRTDLFDLEIQVNPAFRPRRGDRWRVSVDSFTSNLVLSPNEVIAPALLGTPLRLDPTDHAITYGGGLG